MKIYLQRFSYPAVCVKLESRNSKMFCNRRLEKAETLKTLLSITRDSGLMQLKQDPHRCPHPPPIHTGEETVSSCWSNQRAAHRRRKGFHMSDDAHKPTEESPLGPAHWHRKELFD